MSLLRGLMVALLVAMLAFTSQATAQSSSSQPERLTDLGGTVRPVFSADGTKIAFANTSRGLEVTGNDTVTPPSTVDDVYVMNSDGTNLRSIVRDARVSAFAFSPDSTKIAFLNENERVGNQGAGREIYVVSADGTDLTQITNYRKHIDGLSWLPDSERIVFTSPLEGNKSAIYTIEANDSNLTKLTDKQDLLYGQPSVSDDGKLAALTSTPGSSNSPSRQGFFTMNSDGSNQAHFPSPVQRVPVLMLSPDGTKIGLVNTAPPNKLQLMNADGTNLRPVADLPIFLGFRAFVFTPDGKRIAYKSDQDGNEEIYAVNLDGTNPTNLTNDSSSHDSQPTFSPDGKKMAYARGSKESDKYISEIYMKELGSSG